MTLPVAEINRHVEKSDKSTSAETSPERQGSVPFEFASRPAAAMMAHVTDRLWSFADLYNEVIRYG